MPNFFFLGTGAVFTLLMDVFSSSEVLERVVCVGLGVLSLLSPLPAVSLVCLINTWPSFQRSSRR